jgi:uncharacterized protein (TIGR03083 family)
VTIDPGAFLEALAADSQAIADAAPENLDRQVPSCPDWKVADLVGHLGGVYSYATANVEAGGARPEVERARPPAAPTQLVPWFAEWRSRVIEALSSRQPEDPAWSRFTGEGTVGWWRRRQALETAVHLYDVELASGRRASIGPELAAAGIDEFLSELLPFFLSRRQVAGLSGTFHVHATDTPGEWQLDFAKPDLDVRREHGKADTAVRGPADGLYWLWNRTSAEDAGLEVFGDAGIVGKLAEIRL